MKLVDERITEKFGINVVHKKNKQTNIKTAPKFDKKWILEDWTIFNHPSILVAGILGTLRKKDGDKNDKKRKNKLPRVLLDP